MKKLLLILLCLPMIFSCGEMKTEKDEGSLDKEITEKMIVNGYTGKGTITWDGAKYVGEWKDGKCHGQGTLTYTDGTIEEGLWKDGEFLKEQKDFYISEIKSDSTELSKLKNDSKEQEKFAREQFLMKKDNEDIFIIRENEDE